MPFTILDLFVGAVGAAALALAMSTAGSALGDDAAVRAPAKSERIVFFGDSITQQGAAANGYVALVKDAIAAALPEAGVEVIGAGVSGNKVPDLERRLDNAVLAKKPTTVVIYIGINDVWHSQRGQGTPKDAFDKGLRSLVERIRASGSRVILCTPSVIGEKVAGTNPLDAMLDDYAGVTRAVAADMKTGLIDLRKAFVTHLAAEKKDETGQGLLTTDGVHLNAAGNRFVADRMLEALGVPAGAANAGKVLRHVVLFKFKETSTPADVEQIVAAFRGLPGKIPQIKAFEWGTDVSPEGKNQGLTHCFLVTFASEADRDAYLPHPAHKEFVSIVGPHVDKVCVVDYWSAP
ncbi:MAG: Dabb family protein [Planctomycetia bacterium]|nr:Dabb family protein [Planctomycetia bacterium]